MTTTSDNQAKLIQAFATALVIEPRLVTNDLAYQSIAQWDSTAHMLLIAELEAQFDVMLDTDDIIDMSSVERAKAILTKYGVNLG